RCPTGPTRRTRRPGRRPRSPRTPSTSRARGRSRTTASPRSAAGSWRAPRRPGAGCRQSVIKIDDDDLRDVLGDVASSDTAVKIIGESAATFNQTRLIQGAQGVDGWNGPNDSPFQIAAHESTQLQGFLVDSLAHGDISDAEDLEEKRKKVATAMLLPVSLASNLVPTGSEWAERP